MSPGVPSNDCETKKFLSRNPTNVPYALISNTGMHEVNNRAV